MFVLGVDPGLSRCGYCVLDASRSKAEAIGVITTDPKDPVPLRLSVLLSDMRDLLDEFSPDVVAVERVLFQVNVRTAMSVGQASGVVMAEAAGRGISVIEYSPNQVKQTVAGYGAADKEQVQKMVQTLLRLPAPPSSPDAADAAAVALCHLAYYPASRPLEGKSASRPLEGKSASRPLEGKSASRPLEGKSVPRAKVVRS